MKPLRTFTVKPALPAPLARLRDLAYNLRWSWNHATIELFRRLDRDLWETVGNNPVLLLARIDQQRLAAAADDDAFLNHLAGVSQSLDRYHAAETSWFKRHYGSPGDARIAYFSAEFAITNCLPIFSGGLGVLAGDHLKSASDLGLPLVGVGLLYQMGYFRQYLNEAGWQQEAYEENDFPLLPISIERRANGQPLTIDVPIADRSVRAQVWRAQVGRVPLYLLDTNVSGNSKRDCDITDQLYGGDHELRIQQEMVLGIGGMRALAEIGIAPSVCHMNEGHSAFMALERVSQLMQQHKLTFAAAREAASAGLVFTTHTAVPAGHDAFPPELVQRYLGCYATAFGITANELLMLGSSDPRSAGGSFSMSVLALRAAAYANGVSRLHGEVSRRMWQSLYPGVPATEIPVGHVTNGVHFCSWISQEMSQLYDRYLGPSWRDEANLEHVWQRARQIPGEELWRAHERRRERLVVFARNRLRAQLARRNTSQHDLAHEVLDPGALTIGFARRFATYKRATLILSDPERLAAILNAPGRPVQIIFAGKAHPRDEPGKALIQRVVELARQDRFRRHIVFLEDYDLATARYLVQGADVWLNTPRRPLEASGTSGMKAMANGVLNLSVLDGWWAEAWQDGAGAAGTGGWAIGRGEAYIDDEEQDRVEADALYRLLENDVVPAFYERNVTGLPERWVERMRITLAELCPIFNTHRMVQEYTDRFYMPSSERYDRLQADAFACARALADWRKRVIAGWPGVSVTNVNGHLPEEIEAGAAIHVEAEVELHELSNEDVRVQLYLGRIDATGEIADGNAYLMTPVSGGNGNRVLYECTNAAVNVSGRLGFNIRVVPHNEALPNDVMPGYVTWGS